MELYLSSLTTTMPSRVWACNLDRLSELSVSWLKYTIENNSNHVLESGLTLWTSSNGVVSFRPNQPGTWFSIIAVWRTAKYQNYRPNFFSVMNDLAIWIKVRHVRSDNIFKKWCPEGAAIILEPFKRIHRREFPLINLLSKLDWNWWGRRPASDLNCSSAEVIDVDDSEEILYIQQHLVATSTKSRAYQCPPKATQSPKTMSI